MKILSCFFSSLLIFTSIYADQQTISINSDQPLLVVILMVKNEEPVMEATLKPFFDAGVQHYLILDTGSTDHTVATTLQLFGTYNIKHGHVREKPFVDFATSRNHALEFAEELFPDAVFFFMIDAEWYVHNVENLLEFCNEHRNDSETTYLCKITNNSFNFTNYLDRLLRAHTGIQFIGSVHEYIHRIATTKIPDVYICYEPSMQGEEKTRQRWLKDCNILLQEHEKDKTNTRTLFFLAETYQNLNDYQNACFWFEKRCKLSGALAENCIARYKLACNYDKLNKWQLALESHLKAFSMQPRRIEPLVQIAYHYIKTGDYAIAYLFAKHATTITLPEEEVMLIETILYDFVRYQLLGFTAWHVGQYEIGKNATLQALKYFENNPTNSPVLLKEKESLLCNLAIFEQKLAQQ